MDHGNYDEIAKKNGHINPLVAKIEKNPLEKREISDTDYIEALEHLLIQLDFAIGSNANIGYETETRKDKLRNLHFCLMKAERGRG